MYNKYYISIFLTLFTTLTSCQKVNYELGQKSLQFNHHQNALDYFNFILASHPNNINANIGKVCPLIALGKYSEAIQICDLILEKIPNNKIIQRNREIATTYLINSPEKTSILKRPIEYDPNDDKSNYYGQICQQN